LFSGVPITALASLPEIVPALSFVSKIAFCAELLERAKIFPLE